MAGVTRYLSKAAAAAAALATAGVIVGAGPSHAATTDPPVDGTPVTYTVDEDAIAVDSNYTAFAGTMKIFHDGAHVRGALSGTIHATQQDKCIRLAVTFTYADGTQDDTPRDNAPYPCGTSSSSVFISSPVGKDIVKYSYYTRATWGPGYNVSYSSTVEGLVGDAPASDGTCNQLDSDSVSSSGTNLPSFKGSVRYGCVTSTGNTVATLTGTLDKSEVPSGSTGAVDVTISYQDGSSTTGRTSSGTPKLVSDASGQHYVYQVVVSSDPTRDVQAVTVRTLAQVNSGLHVTTYAKDSVSWFGNLVH